MDTPFAIALVVIIIPIISNSIFKFNDIEKKCLMLAVIFLIIGIIVDISAKINPLENLIVPFLAELTGLFVSIIVAFRFVDNYKDQLKEQLWSSVRESAYESTLTDLIMLAIGVYSCLPSASWAEVPGDFSKTREANKDIWGKLNTEIKIFPDLAYKLIGFAPKEVILKEETDKGWVEVEGKNSNGGLSINEEVLIGLIDHSYENIKPYLDEIKNTQIPRLIQSSKDKEVRDALIDFEKSINNYYYNMHRFSSKHLAGHGHGSFVLKSMVTLCENASDLYRKLEQKNRDILLS